MLWTFIIHKFNMKELHYLFSIKFEPSIFLNIVFTILNLKTRNRNGQPVEMRVFIKNATHKKEVTLSICILLLHLSIKNMKQQPLKWQRIVLCVSYWNNFLICIQKKNYSEEAIRVFWSKSPISITKKTLKKTIQSFQRSPNFIVSK